MGGCVCNPYSFFAPSLVGGAIWCKFTILRYGRFRHVGAMELRLVDFTIDAVSVSAYEIIFPRSGRESSIHRARRIRRRYAPARVRNGPYRASTRRRFTDSRTPMGRMGGSESPKIARRFAVGSICHRLQARNLLIRRTRNEITEIHRRADSVSDASRVLVDSRLWYPNRLILVAETT